MFFGLSKICFASDSFSEDYGQDLKSLTLKIRKQFNICVRPAKSDEESQPTLYLALLNLNSLKLNQEIDRILEFCEKQGFGRIEVETSVVDHFDTINTEAHD